MANITTQTIRVDLSTDKMIPTAFTHQNDTARTLEFSIYNKGMPYTMTGNTVKFAYKSPVVDGQYSVIAGSSMASGTVSGNKVTVALPVAYTRISGVGLLTMIITPSSGTIRPVNIRLVVQKSADGDDEIAGASDFPAALDEIAENWLGENISIQIDDTLSVSGKAADAKVTGDEISELDGQIGDLKSDLACLESETATLYSVSWEHGGIDNANGNNNNDGSLTRTRTADYFPITEFSRIENATDGNLFVIRYTLSNGIYTFIGYVRIDPNTSTNITTMAKTFDINDYVRFDARASLESTTQGVKIFSTASTLVNNSINNTGTINEYAEVLDIAWEQGTILDTTGELRATANRLRTSNYIKLDKYDVFLAGTDPCYLVEIYKWDASKNYIGTDPMTTKIIYRAKESGYIKLVLRKNVDAEITTSEAQHVTAKKYTFAEQINSDVINADVSKAYVLSPITEFEPGYISHTGDLAPASTNNERTTNYIDISSESIITAQAWNDSPNDMWIAVSFYDESKTFISRKTQLEQEAEHVLLSAVVPQTAKYVRASFRKYNNGVLKVSAPATYKNLAIASKFTNGYLNDSGEFIKPQHGVNEKTTDFISLDNVEMLTIAQFGTPVWGGEGSSTVQFWLGVSFFTEDKTFISRTSNFLGNPGNYIQFNLREFPENAKYVRLSFRSGADILLAAVANTEIVDCFILADDDYFYLLNENNNTIDKLYNSVIEINGNVKSVNHRGWHEAPENTLPAYMLSKMKGFRYVETDVEFTSDSVAVLLHDSTINRTAKNSDGTDISSPVNISSITYAQALNYDFGTYKGSEYQGTKIPTFEEFIKLCRNLGLRPYVELKTGTQQQVETLVDVANKYGMEKNVTWISFNSNLLSFVKDANSTSRLGLVCTTITSDVVASALALKTQGNDVFIDANYTNTDADIQLCIDAELPLEAWSINSTSIISGLNPYISGVTSDSLLASVVLYEESIG